LETGDSTTIGAAASAREACDSTASIKGVIAAKQIGSASRGILRGMRAQT
jgi:hypothetical protein